MRLLKWVRGLVAFAVVLMLLVGTLVIAVISIRTANSTSDCVNRSLGARSAVGTADVRINAVLHRPAAAKVSDSDVIRAFMTQLETAFRHRNNKAAGRAFVALVPHMKYVLDHNQEFRDAHPLGRC